MQTIAANIKIMRPKICEVLKSKGDGVSLAQRPRGHRIVSSSVVASASTFAVVLLFTVIGYPCIMKESEPLYFV